ncbi:MAG: hypothetical protein ABIG42_12210, partial [bacterium]
LIPELTTFATHLDSENPRVDALNALVGFSVYSGRLEDALSWIDQLIEIEPDNPEHPFTGAILSLRLGNKSAAKEYWESFDGISEKGDEWKYIEKEMETLLKD